MASFEKETEQTTVSDLTSLDIIRLKHIRQESQESEQFSDMNHALLGKSTDHTYVQSIPDTGSDVDSTEMLPGYESDGTGKFSSDDAPGEESPMDDSDTDPIQSEPKVKAQEKRDISDEDHSGTDADPNQQRGAEHSGSSQEPMQNSKQIGTGDGMSSQPPHRSPQNKSLSETGLLWREGRKSKRVTKARTQKGVNIRHKGSYCLDDTCGSFLQYGTCDYRRHLTETSIHSGLSKQQVDDLMLQFEQKFGKNKKVAKGKKPKREYYKRCHKCGKICSVRQLRRKPGGHFDYYASDRVICQNMHREDLPKDQKGINILVSHCHKLDDNPAENKSEGEPGDELKGPEHGSERSSQAAQVKFKWTAYEGIMCQLISQKFLESVRRNQAITYSQFEKLINDTRSEKQNDPSEKDSFHFLTQDDEKIIFKFRKLVNYGWEIIQKDEPTKGTVQSTGREHMRKYIPKDMIGSYKRHVASDSKKEGYEGKKGKGKAGGKLKAKYSSKDHMTNSSGADSEKEHNEGKLRKGKAGGKLKAKSSSKDNVTNSSDSDSEKEGN